MALLLAVASAAVASVASVPGAPAASIDLPRQVLPGRVRSGRSMSRSPGASRFHSTGLSEAFQKPVNVRRGSLSLCARSKVPPEPPGRRNPRRRREFASGFMFGLLAAVAGYEIQPYTVSYSTAADVPEKLVRRQGWLGGVVASVPDGDGLRIEHIPPVNIPSFFGQANQVRQQKLSARTISIRLYGIDAPEVAKFGQKGQPYAQESKKYLQNMVQGRHVNVQMLSRDQYGRIVGRVRVGRWPFRADVSEEMLKGGLAEVYTGGGAQYAGNEMELRALEAHAKNEKRGMWEMGESRLESPADYKRRMRAAAAMNILPAEY